MILRVILHPCCQEGLHGNHNSGRHQYASSNNHAYFVGQYTQGSQVQRVDYADDFSNTLLGFQSSICYV